jgi:hypothetical protein
LFKKFKAIYIWIGRRKYNEIDPIKEEELDNSKKSSSGWFFLGVLNKDKKNSEILHKILKKIRI